MRGNADLLGAALANVLENAIKYSEPPSPVVAAIGVDDRRITIDVSDSGCGIDEEELPHIFEPFFRGSRTSAIPGTGVGLALVLTVINHHRGAVTVESGAGTSVRITLPVGR